jgi:hypothetical protein
MQLRYCGGVGPASERQSQLGCGVAAHAVTLEQAGVFALKGRSKMARAYRVVSLESPKGAATRRSSGGHDCARWTKAAVAKPAVLLGSPPALRSRRRAHPFRRCEELEG